MNKLQIITFTFITIFLLHGCTKILEPLSFDGTLAQETLKKQENLQINIESLTFENARKTKKFPYPRKLIQTGAGSQAKVLNENIFLASEIPTPRKNIIYKIGVGDKLSFTYLPEFTNEPAQWPKKSSYSDYLIGIGDQLTFIQEKKVTRQNIQLDTSSLQQNINNEQIVTTRGYVGSNGNILLLGLGNIKAIDRTITELREEVRNILIRNGLAPNFQLEITNFESKKAYITTPDRRNIIISINNIPTTLQEVTLSTGVSGADKKNAIITLNRGTEKYRATAEQLFSNKKYDIKIQNNDQIYVEYLDQGTINAKATVGFNGKILFPIIGSVSAINRTLNEVQSEIAKKLSKKGLGQEFQLEIINFASKKAYLISQDFINVIIPLTDKNISLQALILQYESPNTSADNLSIYTLRRGGKVYQFTKESIFNANSKELLIQHGDQIEIKSLNYKPSQVFALSGSGKAKIMEIDPSKRETLADILFLENGALSNREARRSEVYLLRGLDPTIAYHLDAQNVSKILIAAQTELRPNDIIFVADRPIISFTRTLAELNPLRILLRDLKNSNIP
jgi:protein involved in polysaccharide export with SLBB domain